MVSKKNVMIGKMTSSPHKSDIWRKREEWFRSVQGMALLGVERNRIGRRLRTLFGYHILQVGESGDVDFLATSKISHKLVASLIDDKDLSAGGFRCDACNLPCASDSLDVVVLPHVLEFETHPHQVLRESGRILIGEGHIVILGFNPWSLWGLSRWVPGWGKHVPWCGRPVRLARLEDWLKLLDFEIVSTEYFYFRPPLRTKKWLKRLAWMEGLGGLSWCFFGGVYLLVAKKCVRPLTPIKLKWRAQRKVIASGAVSNPTNRETL